jgi:hypothetical protein
LASLASERAFENASASHESSSARSASEQINFSTKDDASLQSKLACTSCATAASKPKTPNANEIDNITINDLKNNFVAKFDEVATHNLSAHVIRFISPHPFMIFLVIVVMKFPG